MMYNNKNNLQENYHKARERLTADVFHFIDAGSGDEKALQRNANGFDRYHLSPRVLCGLNNLSTETDLLGQKLTAPILIAPAAYQALLSSGGELDMLEAVNQFNTIMVLSMFSSVAYQQLAAKKQGALWLQMYLLKDRGINQAILDMAEAENFDAIVLTVDAPVYARREREMAQPLRFPAHLDFAHLDALGIPVAQSLKTKKHLSQLLDPSISWNDIDWLAANTRLPIILKGVMDPRDSKIALDYDNVKGIIISNHGGRQLDSALSAIEVLDKHRQIVGDQFKLLVDGAISRGSDVFKALALGADATLIGRHALWALAVHGPQGVLQLLSQLQAELAETMALCGCSTIQSISYDFIVDKEKR